MVIATVTDNISYLARLSLVMQTVTEGKSYVVRATVTNQSIKVGVPVEATLGVVFTAATAYEIITPRQEKQESFAPGETKTLDFPMDIPTGLTGREGIIYVEVTDPTGVVIASDTKDLIIEAPPLIFTCPYCGETFGSLTEVTGHQQTCEMRLAIIQAGYPAPIMYPCPYCSWFGYYEWDYWRHLWYHRPDIPKPEKYACHYCRTTFDTASDLMGHIRSVHGLPVPTPTPEEAAFYLWDLYASAVVGQVSTVSLRIINYGGDTGEYSIEATIDGQKSTSEGKLTPAEQGAATFTFTPTRAGTHQITANGFTGSFEVVAPKGTISVISLSLPDSAPGGTQVTGTLTYQVTGQVGWAILYIYAYPGVITEVPMPVSPGTHTVSITVWQPSDGYMYHAIQLYGQYGVYSLWTDVFLQTGWNLYLEE